LCSALIVYPALALDAAFSSHTGAYALDPIPTLRDSNDLKDGALAPYLEMIEEGLTRSASPLSTLHHFIAGLSRPCRSA
jgi:hypothetical protein